MKRFKVSYLQIAQLGCPVLREMSSKVTKCHDLTIQQLIINMIATVIDVSGVGIAAPQVYKSLQIFILASKANPRYPDAPNMKPIAILNPVILSHSINKVKGWEGCLSIPGIRGFIPRYESLSVRFTNRKNEQIEKTFHGFVARIFQHEYDHITGKVFLDRLETNQDIISEKEYLKLVKSS